MPKGQRFARINLPIHDLARITASAGLSFLREKIDNTLSDETNKKLNSLNTKVAIT